MISSQVSSSEEAVKKKMVPSRKPRVTRTPPKSQKRIRKSSVSSPKEGQNPPKMAKISSKDDSSKKAISGSKSSGASQTVSAFSESDQ